MAETVKCKAVGETGALHYGVGMAGCSVSLVVAILNDSSSSSTGAKVEVWGQWQLVKTEGSELLLQPQSWACCH